MPKITAMLITPENIEDVKSLCEYQKRPPELWPCVLETEHYALVDEGRAGTRTYILSAPIFRRIYKFVEPEDNHKLVEVEMA